MLTWCVHPYISFIRLFAARPLYFRSSLWSFFSARARFLCRLFEQRSFLTAFEPSSLSRLAFLLKSRSVRTYLDCFVLHTRALYENYNNLHFNLKRKNCTLRQIVDNRMCVCSRVCVAMGRDLIYGWLAIEETNGLRSRPRDNKWSKCGSSTRKRRMNWTFSYQFHPKATHKLKSFLKIFLVIKFQHGRHDGIDLEIVRHSSRISHLDRTAERIFRWLWNCSQNSLLWIFRFLFVERFRWIGSSLEFASPRLFARIRTTTCRHFKNSFATFFFFV